MKSFLKPWLCNAALKGGMMLVVAVSLPAWVIAQAPVINTFSGNGEISWNHPTNGVLEYRIEWAPNLIDGAWSDLHVGPPPILPATGNQTASVPMHYRVRALGPAPTNMVYIPGGWFRMGSAFASGTAVEPHDEEEAEGSPDELPVHSVYIAAFYMDQFEVSNVLWDEVLAWAVTNGYSFANEIPDLNKGGTYPVHSVNWFDCVKWCNARSERDGLAPVYYKSLLPSEVYKTGTFTPFYLWGENGYRLPTEAEWEKAARGGASGRRFPWADADTIQHARANYYASSSFGYDTSPTLTYHPDFSGVQPYTLPVGTFAPNGYGLYNMAGNLSEWCWDWYQDDYYAVSPDSNPKGPGSFSLDDRVRRGGWWESFPSNARVANRRHNIPEYANYDTGFRCVKGL